MEINFSLTFILNLLLSFILFLLIMNSIGIGFIYYYDYDYYHVPGLIRMFNLNRENNIPTLYSCFQLMISAILLLVIAVIAVRTKEKGHVYLYWIGLAMIFFFLSLDEMFGFHERTSMYVRNYFNVTGLLYYAWVIPYGIVGGIFVLLYLRFLKQLPKRTMIMFIVSGTIYIIGAIGFEMFGGQEKELYGDTFLYHVLYTFEELFEMLGIAIFIYSLLSYIVRDLDSFSVKIVK
ncbi:MAG: hypothetical protein WBF77_02420 [Sulfurimonadaceae bacterium]